MQIRKTRDYETFYRKFLFKEDLFWYIGLIGLIGFLLKKYTCILGKDKVQCMLYCILDKVFFLHNVKIKERQQEEN